MVERLPEEQKSQHRPGWKRGGSPTSIDLGVPGWRIVKAKGPEQGFTSQVYGTERRPVWLQNSKAGGKSMEVQLERSLGTR